MTKSWGEGQRFANVLILFSWSQELRIGRSTKFPEAAVTKIGGKHAGAQFTKPAGNENTGLALVK
jgi:hypothetical protein